MQNIMKIFPFSFNAKIEGVFKTDDMHNDVARKLS